MITTRTQFELPVATQPGLAALDPFRQGLAHVGLSPHLDGLAPLPGSVKLSLLGRLGFDATHSTWQQKSPGPELRDLWMIAGGAERRGNDDFPSNSPLDYYRGLVFGLGVSRDVALEAGEVESAATLHRLQGTAAELWLDRAGLTYAGRTRHLGEARVALGIPPLPPEGSADATWVQMPGALALQARLSLYATTRFIAADAYEVLHDLVNQRVPLAALVTRIDETNLRSMEAFPPLAREQVTHQHFFSPLRLLACLEGSAPAVGRFHEQVGASAEALDASVPQAEIDALTTRLADTNTSRGALAEIAALAPRGARVLPAVIAAALQHRHGTPIVPALLARFGPLAAPHLAPLIQNQPRDGKRLLSHSIAALGPWARSLVPRLTEALAQTKDPSRQTELMRLIARAGPDALLESPEALDHLEALRSIAPDERYSAAVTRVAGSNEWALEERCKMAEQLLAAVRTTS